MRVRELAEHAGVSSHAVRYYDRLGLLDATREPDNRYRQFDRAALNRMRFIRSAKKLGFTLSEIQGILAMGHAHESPCPTVREIVRKRIRENAALILFNGVAGSAGQAPAPGTHLVRRYAIRRDAKTWKRS